MLRRGSLRETQRGIPAQESGGILAEIRSLQEEVLGLRVRIDQALDEPHHHMLTQERRLPGVPDLDGVDMLKMEKFNAPKNLFLVPSAKGRTGMLRLFLFEESRPHQFQIPLTEKPWSLIQVLLDAAKKSLRSRNPNDGYCSTDHIVRALERDTRISASTRCAVPRIVHATRQVLDEAITKSGTPIIKYFLPTETNGPEKFIFGHKIIEFKKGLGYRLSIRPEQIKFPEEDEMR